jgi:hypothetical protein
LQIDAYEGSAIITLTITWEDWPLVPFNGKLITIIGPLAPCATNGYNLVRKFYLIWMHAIYYVGL